jgi:SSS family solute:Na+ symporter
MSNYLPSGVLGLAITGLVAAFMSGMAANVTAFNTVVTYDIWQAYVRKDAPDAYYIWFGRVATVVGIAIAIGTAFIASGYSNIMDYIQLLFSYFNAPLFATFVFAMFWKRTTPWGGFFGIVTGTICAVIAHESYANGWISYGSAQDANFWGAIAAFVGDAVVTVGVSLVTTPKPEEELRGLVWGLTRTDARDEELAPAERVWYRSPYVLAAGLVVLIIILNIIFI